MSGLFLLQLSTNAMTQSEWDDLLVTCFYERKEILMYRLCVDLKTVENIKRAPKYPHHINLKVTRFICAHLPQLANVLWKTPAIHKHKIIQVLSRSRINTTEDLSWKTMQEKKERLKVKKQIIVSSLQRYGEFNHARKSGGHDWNVCK